MQRRASMRPYELLVLVGVIIGWLATHLFSEARERRKEVRASLDKIIERVVAISASAATFHMSESFNESKANEIVAQIERIERMLGRLWLAKSDQVDPLIIELRRAVSLKNFESSSFVRQSLNSEIILNISAVAKDLEDYLEDQYSAQYPSGFPYIYPSLSTVVFIAVVALLALGLAVGLSFMQEPKGASVQTSSAQGLSLSLS